MAFDARSEARLAEIKKRDDELFARIHEHVKACEQDGRSPVSREFTEQLMVAGFTYGSIVCAWDRYERLREGRPWPIDKDRVLN